jgi:hypothetical protein
MEQPDYTAVNTEFRSNELSGVEFGIDATTQNHSYSVYWTLIINLYNKQGLPLKGTDLKVVDRNGKEVVSQLTNENGSLKVELPEYLVDSEGKKYLSPYTIIAGKKKIILELKKNTETDIVLK